MPKAIKLPSYSIRAEFRPDTYDEEKRTIEVVWTKGARVLRTGWDGRFYEELSTDKKAVKLDRLNSGAPFLDNHGGYRPGLHGQNHGQIGVVQRAWLENGEGRAEVKFSNRQSIKEIIDDVRDGVISKISVGYRINKLEKLEESVDQIPVYRAVDWEPFELTLTSVPADNDSSVRSKDENHEPNDVVIITNHKTDMDKNKQERLAYLLIKRSLNDDETTELEQLRSEADEAGILNEFRTLESEKSKTEPKTTNVRGLSEADIEKAIQRAQTDERERTSEISLICRQLKLEDSFREKLIADGVTADEARKRALEQWEKSDPAKGTGTHRVEFGKDEVEKVRSTMSDAIALRASSVASKDIEPEDVKTAREFRGMNLMDMATYLMQRSGVNTFGMSKREIAMTALGVGERASGYHGVADFPIILGDTINRTLRAAYDNAGRTFLPWTRRATLSDFRPVTRAQIGDMPPLDEVKEGEEYAYGTVGEGKETYSLIKYGKRIALSWEALINDDLSAFARVPEGIAARAADRQSHIVYGILLDNPNMSDGTALFHNNHGNLASAAAISVDGLGAARALMRKQKGKGDGRKTGGGNRKEPMFINVNPRYLLVGPDNEQTALQFLSSAYNPENQAQINPWTPLMQPIVEPRLDTKNWFVSADPTQIDTIEYAFLAGEEELFTEQREGFDIDGLEIKVRMVFAAKAIDHRGLVKNPYTG